MPVAPQLGGNTLADGLGREAACEQLRCLERAALLRDSELRLSTREVGAGDLTWVLVL